jgi:hypothetical protein
MHTQRQKGGEGRREEEKKAKNPRDSQNGKKKIKI